MIRRELLRGLAAGIAAAAIAPRSAPAQTAPTPASAAAGGSGWSVPIQAVRSPGGIAAWLIEDRSIPVVALRFAIRDAGVAADAEGREGLAAFAAATLDEGAGQYDASAFQSALRDRAISLSFSAGRETFAGTLRMLAEETNFAAEMLRLALAAPRFDTPAIERMRASLLSSLRRSRENPRSIASRLWWAGAFPGHPFGRDPQGTEAALATLSAEDLRGFAPARLRRGALVVGASGAISATELGALLDHVFGALAGGTPPALPALPTARAFGTIVEERPNPQSVAVFGHHGMAQDDADWVAAIAVNRILAGGGFSSRLTEQVRERRGLAYGVSAQLVPLARGSVILGSVATENATMTESLSLIRAEWQRMASEGPTATELDDTKAFLTGSFPLQFTSTPQIASLLVDLQLSDRPIDWLATRDARIRAITPEVAARAARRLYDASALSIAVVGRPAGLRTAPG